MKGSRDLARSLGRLAADHEERLLELPQIRRRGFDQDAIERRPRRRTRGVAHVVVSDVDAGCQRTPGRISRTPRPSMHRDAVGSSGARPPRRHADLEWRRRAPDGPPRACRTGDGRSVRPASPASSAERTPRSSRRPSSRSGGGSGTTRTAVQRALWVDRTLVKTFGPRGTVHLLATADLPMWTGALTALPSSAPGFPESVRFPPQQAEEVIAAIGTALADTELTVDELTDALRDRVGPWAVERTMPAFQVLWPRWRQLTSTAAHRGVLCFGPDRGRNVTYTNPHRWLPGFVPEDGATALRTLVRRYLHAYGPATPQHFGQWLAIPPRRAVEVFDAMADDLERVELEGAPAWTVAGDTSTPSQGPPGIRLLPYFDAFVVAGQPRALLFPGMAATRALTPSGQAGNYPVLLVDGVVGGVWHQRRYRSEGGDHRRAHRRLTSAAAPPARRRGGPRRVRHGGRADPGRRSGDGRRARLTGWLFSRPAIDGRGVCRGQGNR